MITKYQLEVVARYKGDIDWFVRAGTSDERASVSDDEWGRIDELVRALIVIERGLAAETFSERIRLALEAEVAEGARPRLRGLSIDAMSWS